MPKTLADTRTKLTVLTDYPDDLSELTAADLNAGEDIQCRINKSDFTLGPTGSDTTDDTEMCEEGTATTFAASQYEGSITPFRYLDDDGKSEVQFDVAWALLKNKGTEVCLARRDGPVHSVPWADGDEFSAFVVITDNPQYGERTGFIKYVIPLGIQKARLHQILGAAAPVTP